MDILWKTHLLASNASPIKIFSLKEAFMIHACWPTYAHVPCKYTCPDCRRMWPSRADMKDDFPAPTPPHTAMSSPCWVIVVMVSHDTIKSTIQLKQQNSDIAIIILINHLKQHNAEKYIITRGWWNKKCENIIRTKITILSAPSTSGTNLSSFRYEPNQKPHLTSHPKTRENKKYEKNRQWQPSITNQSSLCSVDMAYREYFFFSYES